MKRIAKTVLSLLLITVFLTVTVLQAAAAGSATPTDPCGGDHDWDGGKLTTKRGCETPGVMTYTCKRCGKTKTQNVSALGHDWGDWFETESHGQLIEKRVCNRCGIYQTRPIETKVLGAEVDHPAITIELLSFNPPDVWLPGAKCTGELKVTNSGDTLVIVTSYRICEANGQFCFNDKLESWPEGSAILSPGDSFTLTVSVVTLSTESEAKKVVRTFTVSGETFRENETEHDPVTSNTVTGTAEYVVKPVAITIELDSFNIPEDAVAGDEVSGQLTVSNTGEDWVLVTGYRICDAAGQFCFNDKLEDWPGSAILSVGNSFTLSVRVILTDADISAGKVVRTFSVSGESFRENETEHDPVTSNTVEGAANLHEPVPDPEDPEEPGEGGDAEVQECFVSLILCHDGSAGIRIAHCPEHTVVSAKARALLEEGQPAAQIWFDTLGSLYDELLAGAQSDEARAVITAEHDAFFAFIEKEVAMLEAKYPDDPLEVDRLIFLILEAECSDLCRIIHGAPVPVPEVDEFITNEDSDAANTLELSFTGTRADAAEACFEALVPVVNGNPDLPLLEAAAQGWKFLWSFDSSDLGPACSAWADAHEKLLTLYDGDRAAVLTDCLTLWLFIG